MKNNELFNEYPQSAELSKADDNPERETFLAENVELTDELIDSGKITQEQLIYINKNQLGLGESMAVFENWNYNLHKGTLQLAERMFQQPEPNTAYTVDKLQRTIEVSNRLTLSDINSLKPDLVQSSLLMTIDTVDQLLNQVKGNFDPENIEEYVRAEARRDKLRSQFK